MERNRISRAIACTLLIPVLFCGCERPPRAELVPTTPTEMTTEVTETIPPMDVDLTEPEEPLYSEEAYSILEAMSIEEKVAQCFMVTPEQLLGQDKPVYAEDYITYGTESLTAALDEYPVGGVVLFGGNITDPRGTTAFTSVFSSEGMFVAIDEEGGDITRIASDPDFDVTVFPPMSEINDSYEVGLTIGTYLRDFGFNLDFAPVADIVPDPSNNVIGNRSFGDEYTDVSAHIISCVSGFNDAGILCSLKHFPGHGDTGGDSHYGAAVLDKTLDELRDSEFKPFEAGIETGCPFVMVGHITVPEVTGDIPATLSSVIMTDILREELGFNGIIITDSFQMGAITDYYSADEAAVQAILAGADMVLMPDDFYVAYQGVTEAVYSGRISEERLDESVLRIIQTKLDQGIM